MTCFIFGLPISEVDPVPFFNDRRGHAIGVAVRSDRQHLRKRARAVHIYCLGMNKFMCVFSGAFQAVTQVPFSFFGAEEPCEWRGSSRLVATRFAWPHFAYCDRVAKTGLALAGSAATPRMKIASRTISGLARHTGNWAAVCTRLRLQCWFARELHCSRCLLASSC